MSENVIDINDDTFSEAVAEGIVLVDFWAEWCNPCVAFIPTLEKFASENEDIKVFKANVEECGSVSSDMGIRSVPTLSFFKDGSEVKRLLGATTIEYLQEALDEIMGEDNG